MNRTIDEFLESMTLEDKAHELGNDAPANERLGIARMNHGEILHGVMWRPRQAESDPVRYEGAGPTIFPQAIAMGCTFDPELVETIGQAIAREARSLDRHHCYSPCLDVAWDCRFGRVEETFGEDPHLVSRLGVAIIHGFQGRGPERFDGRHVLATAKHFAGYGEVRGGLNGEEVNIGERRLREVHLPPFEAAVKEAGVASIMPSHHAQEGVPCHANLWLLRDLLRREWGFQGFLVSDNIDLYRLHTMQRVAADEDHAAILGVRAGVDLELELGRSEERMCYSRLPRLVREGRVSELEVDQLVRRVLEAKERMGLLEGDGRGEDPKQVCGSAGHRALALEAALASHVLLENDGLLPLEKKTLGRLALIGPHVDRCELGGYVGEITAEVTPPLQGLRRILGPEADIVHAPGAGFGTEMDATMAGNEGMIQDAVRTAQGANAIVLLLGGTRQTCGEGRDNADIRLPGQQHELAHAILDLGKPTVLVLIGGRPWAIGDISRRCNAVLLAWYGGVEAGNAIAQTLFGHHNPGGKLCMSFPQSAGHVQCSYLRRPFFNGAGWGDYRQHDKQPFYPFGHGLSYTEFAWGPIILSTEKIGAAGSLKASVEVTNTGSRAGDEVVQCYLSDEMATVTPFVKQLRGFKRIHLEPGQTRKIEFTIGPDELAIWNIHMEQVVEPGWFTIQIGGSSMVYQNARFEVVEKPLRSGKEISEESVTIRRDQDMEAPN